MSNSVCPKASSRVTTIGPLLSDLRSIGRGEQKSASSDTPQRLQNADNLHLANPELRRDVRASALRPHDSRLPPVVGSCRVQLRQLCRDRVDPYERHANSSESVSSPAWSRDRGRRSRGPRGHSLANRWSFCNSGIRAKAGFDPSSFFMMGRRIKDLSPFMTESCVTTPASSRRTASECFLI